jgi:hypothetical protein
MKRLKASNNVSAPFWTPTPSCRGRRYLDAASLKTFTQHLEMSLLKISPTAIGRTEHPSFFRMGTREALDIKGANDGNAFPVRNIFTKAVKFS